MSVRFSDRSARAALAIVAAIPWLSIGFL